MSYLQVLPFNRDVRRKFKRDYNVLYKAFTIRKDRSIARYHDLMLYRAVLLNKHRENGFTYKGSM